MDFHLQKNRRTGILVFVFYPGLLMKKNVFLMAGLIVFVCNCQSNSKKMENEEMQQEMQMPEENGGMQKTPAAPEEQKAPVDLYTTPAPESTPPPEAPISPANSAPSEQTALEKKAPAVIEQKAGTTELPSQSAKVSN